MIQLVCLVAAMLAFIGEKILVLAIALSVRVANRKMSAVICEALATNRATEQERRKAAFDIKSTSPHLAVTLEELRDVGDHDATMWHRGVAYAVRTIERECPHIAFDRGGSMGDVCVTCGADKSIIDEIRAHPELYPELNPEFYIPNSIPNSTRPKLDAHLAHTASLT